MRFAGSRDAATKATVIDQVHGAHVGESAHVMHGPPVVVVVADDVDSGGSSPNRPHVPTQCPSATACTGMALAVSFVLIDDAPHHSAQLRPDTPLAPLSPALAVEPPPPRA